MRFLVMRPCVSRRDTSIRITFMPTGVISCRTGTTNAPPLMTTFTPPKPVRSLFRRAAVKPTQQIDGYNHQDRQDDQPEDHRPDSFRAHLDVSLLAQLPECDGLELPGLVDHGAFGWQALHRGSAVKAVAMPGRSQDVFGVCRFGHRAAMREHDRLRIDGERRLGPCVDQRRTLLELSTGLRPDRAARSQPEMADDDVGARLGHCR